MLKVFSVVPSVHRIKCKLLSSSSTALHNLTLTHLLSVILTTIPKNAMLTLYITSTLLQNCCTLSHICALVLAIPLSKTFTCLHLANSIPRPRPAFSSEKLSQRPLQAQSLLLYAFCYVDPHHWVFPNLLFYIWLPDSMLFQGRSCFSLIFICTWPDSLPVTECMLTN